MFFVRFLNINHVLKNVFKFMHTVYLPYYISDTKENEVNFQRNAKQILLQPAYGYPLINYVPSVAQIPIAHAQASPSIVAPTDACYNSKGESGSCVPFRQCYPYFKVPNVGNFDSWVLGMYDTCSYYTAQGRQVSSSYR